MNFAISLPPYGELYEPRLLAELAVEAEEAGFDGFFLWDHILRRPSEPHEVGDVWIALAAIAMSTKSIRIGPMVTPIVRRRPQKLAREAVTLDHLSAGRLTLGLGLGVDTYGELTMFNDVVEPITRGDMLDEGAELLRSLLSGEMVFHRGRHYVADGVQFLPRPIQHPSIPFWFAARGDARRPVRRAALYEGLFGIEVDLDGISRMVDIIDSERGGHDGFDIAVHFDEDSDVDELVRRGVTWVMSSLQPGTTAADVRTLIAQCRPR